MNTRFIIDCADHRGFERILSGEKTVITRANKSFPTREDYTLAHTGDVLELVDLQTGATVLVVVVDTRFFESISAMFHQSTVADETFDKHFTSEDELRAEYEKNRPGYSLLLDQNGIVVWHIKLLLRSS